MASITKTPNGRWRAQVYKDGKRPARTFDSKAQARDWAARTLYQINEAIENPHGKKTFADVLERYAREISPAKRGHRWERIRIDKFLKDPIADVRLAELSPSHFADWRDRRLKDVSGSTVAREMQLISHAAKLAVREWQWIDRDPTTGVSHPRKNPPRDRLISADEIERLMFVAGYDQQLPPITVQQRTVHCFLFAIETAMRAGEIVGLNWNQVFIDRRVIVLRQGETKNALGREVPLSTEAARLLTLLPADNDPCFGLKSSQLDAVFRKLRDKAGINNLHFHDTRHEAITRLAKKLDVLSLARSVGHRNLSMLQIYYNETGEELAKRLD